MKFLLTATFLPAEKIFAGTLSSMQRDFVGQDRVILKELIRCLVAGLDDGSGDSRVFIGEKPGVQRNPFRWFYGNFARQLYSL